MKVCAIIEARMGSTRLPGKTLMPIVGRPMLARLLDRLRPARSLHELVVATTDRVGDDAIELLCKRENVCCFRGSELDVLDRVLRAAQSRAADVIAEITADCALLDAATVDPVVERFLRGDCDFAWNNFVKTFPVGFGVRVFTTRALAEIAQLTRDPDEREHVSLYFWRHPERFRIASVESGLPPECSGYRLVVDTADDFALVSAIFHALLPENPAFGVADVVRLLESRPELASQALRTAKAA